MSDTSPPAPPRHPDRLAAIASGFVAALALAVSTYNVYLQRQQIRAQVWPRLQWSYDNVGGFDYSLLNGGVGPAEIEAVRVTVDGKPVATWDEVLRLTTGAERPHINSFMVGRVLGPGVEIRPLRMEKGADADAVNAARARIDVDICYCSSLHDCWHLAHALKPVTEVPSCPPYAEPFQE